MSTVSPIQTNLPLLSLQVGIISNILHFLFNLGHIEVEIAQQVFLFDCKRKLILKQLDKIISRPPLYSAAIRILSHGVCSASISCIQNLIIQANFSLCGTFLWRWFNRFLVCVSHRNFYWNYGYINNNLNLYLLAILYCFTDIWISTLASSTLFYLLEWFFESFNFNKQRVSGLEFLCGSFFFFFFEHHILGLMTGFASKCFALLPGEEVIEFHWFLSKFTSTCKGCFFAIMLASLIWLLPGLSITTGNVL